MTEHITGRQARELLDGTTPGPWEAGPSMTLSTTVAVFSHGYGPVAFVSNREGGVDEVPAMTDGTLAAAAPALAETVAWLYGREPGRDRTHGIGLRTIRPAGVYVEMDGYEMRPETAVDLARGLLAAAEEARRG